MTLRIIKAKSASFLSLASLMPLSLTLLSFLHRTLKNFFNLKYFRCHEPICSHTQTYKDIYTCITCDGWYLIQIPGLKNVKTLVTNNYSSIGRRCLIAVLIYRTVNFGGSLGFDGVCWFDF